MKYFERRQGHLALPFTMFRTCVYCICNSKNRFKSCDFESTRTACQIYKIQIKLYGRIPIPKLKGGCIDDFWRGGRGHSPDRFDQFSLLIIIEISCRDE